MKESDEHIIYHSLDKAMIADTCMCGKIFYAIKTYALHSDTNQT